MAWIQVGQEIFDKVKDHNEAESDWKDFIENQAFMQKRHNDTSPAENFNEKRLLCKMYVVNMIYCIHWSFWACVQELTMAKKYQVHSALHDFKIPSLQRCIRLIWVVPWKSWASCVHVRPG